MIKPSVCSSELCVFSHLQYGIGEDIASQVINLHFPKFKMQIIHHPQETDLLITLTAAAALGPDPKVNS